MKSATDLNKTTSPLKNPNSQVIFQQRSRESALKLRQSQVINPVLERLYGKAL